jgi:hypothetical protein
MTVKESFGATIGYDYELDEFQISSIKSLISVVVSTLF